MTLSIKKLSRGALFSLGLSMIASPVVHGSSDVSRSMPDIEETPTHCTLASCSSDGPSSLEMLDAPYVVLKDTVPMPSDLMKRPETLLTMLKAYGFSPDTLSHVLATYGPYMDAGEFYFQAALQMYSAESNISDPPFPKSLITGAQEETEGEGEVFQFPSVADVDQRKAWHPYLAALYLSILEGYGPALKVHMRLAVYLPKLNLGHMMHFFQRAGVASQGSVVDDFATWLSVTENFLLKRYVKSDEDKVGFLRGSKPSEWQATVFSTDIIPADTGEFTTKQVMALLSTATRFGDSMTKFETELFEMFEDEKLKLWIRSENPMFFANARLKMPQIFFMIPYAYQVVGKIAHLKQSDLVEGSAEDALYSKALYEAYDAFAAPYLMNINFLNALKHSEAVEVHVLFMNSLLQDLKRTAIDHLSHPYYREGQGETLSAEVVRSRLKEKEEFLGKVLPNFEFSLMWFEALCKGYEKKEISLLRELESASLQERIYREKVEAFQLQVAESNRVEGSLHALEASLQALTLAQNNYDKTQSEGDLEALETAKEVAREAEKNSPFPREAEDEEGARANLDIFLARYEIAKLTAQSNLALYQKFLALMDRTSAHRAQFEKSLPPVREKLEKYTGLVKSAQTFHGTLQRRHQEIRQELGLGVEEVVVEGEGAAPSSAVDLEAHS